MRITDTSQLSQKMKDRLDEALKREKLPHEFSDSGIRYEDGMPEQVDVVIEGKIRPIKNSKDCVGNGKVVMSKRAAAWLMDAKTQLGIQHPYQLLDAVYDVDVHIYYQDRSHWLDSDNALSSVMDALKGTVIKDDSPRFIRRATCTPHLAPAENPRAEIRLTRFDQPYPYLDT